MRRTGVLAVSRQPPILPALAISPPLPVTTLSCTSIALLACKPSPVLIHLAETAHDSPVLDCIWILLTSPKLVREQTDRKREFDREQVRKEWAQGEDWGWGGTGWLDEWW